jgi:hypothetical protein
MNMSKTSQETRREFMQFFEQRGHVYVPSSSVLLADDPTLLFASRESERVQLTVCAETEHAHSVPDALVGVRPRGSVSFIVTRPLVAPRRLMFETVIVKLALDPRVKLPT